MLLEKMLLTFIFMFIFSLSKFARGVTAASVNPENVGDNILVGEIVEETPSEPEPMISSRDLTAILGDKDNKYE